MPQPEPRRCSLLPIARADLRSLTSFLQRNPICPIPGGCLHRLRTWAWPSVCCWPLQVGWRSPSSQNTHSSSVTVVPTWLSTLPVLVSNAGGQLLVLWEMLDCWTIHGVRLFESVIISPGEAGYVHYSVCVPRIPSFLLSSSGFTAWWFKPLLDAQKSWENMDNSCPSGEKLRMGKSYIFFLGDAEYIWPISVPLHLFWLKSPSHIFSWMMWIFTAHQIWPSFWDCK